MRDLIKATEINVYRQGEKILDDVSVSLGHHDFLTIIGPNGAGKSTFINILADLVKKTAELNMSAVALTDKANMMGAFHFYRSIRKHNEDDQNQDKQIKPIIGCELNLQQLTKQKLNWEKYIGTLRKMTSKIYVQSQ